MKAVYSARGVPLVQSSVEALVAEHGARRVLFQTLRALLRSRAPVRVVHVDALSPHLRRDIGLPPWTQGRDWRDLR